MTFHTVFDLILHKARHEGHSKPELFARFRKMGVKQEELLITQVSGMIPDDEVVLKAILNYLDVSKLELELALGRIPAGFEKTYLDKVKEIAKLIGSQKAKDNVQDKKGFKTAEPYFETKNGALYNGNCLDLFSLVPNSSIDCIFADPPFNLDKEYDEGVHDNRSYSEYLSWSAAWLDECVRVLKPNASLFIYNIPKWHVYLGSYLNAKLKFASWIAVDMKFSLPIQNRLYPSHYSLLHFVKGPKPKTFNAQRLPLQTCRHCGGDIRDYGGYKNKMNPEGVNLSDVWTDIYPVRHLNTKNRKFNELPVKLLDRVLTMSTNKGDLVLDPFGGSGTTFAVSELLERKWVGFELGNCDIIKQRLMHKESDKKLLQKIYEEKNKLFPEKVRGLRKKNGFWLPEDFDEKEAAESLQVSFLK